MVVPDPGVPDLGVSDPGALVGDKGSPDPGPGVAMVSSGGGPWSLHLSPALVPARSLLISSGDDEVSFYS